jgi:hypothetical protein
MELKREVSVSVVGPVSVWVSRAGMAAGTRSALSENTELSAEEIILRLPHWRCGVWPPAGDNTQSWEMTAFAALWVCGLVGIGLCFAA